MPPLSATNLRMNIAQRHVSTWPSKIQIAAAQEKAVTPPEFHSWVNQNGGILCKITGQRRPETPQGNETLLSQLINSLTEKSMVSLFLALRRWSNHDANSPQSTLWLVGRFQTGRGFEK